MSAEPATAPPPARLRELPRGASFETLLTGRVGVVLSPANGYYGAGVLCDMGDGNRVFHGDVLVRRLPGGP